MKKKQIIRQKFKSFNIIEDDNDRLKIFQNDQDEKQKES